MVANPWSKRHSLGGHCKRCQVYEEEVLESARGECILSPEEFYKYPFSEQ